MLSLTAHGTDWPQPNRKISAWEVFCLIHDSVPSFPFLASSAAWLMLHVSVPPGGVARAPPPSTCFRERCIRSCGARQQGRGTGSHRFLLRRLPRCWAAGAAGTGSTVAPSSSAAVPPCSIVCRASRKTMRSRTCAERAGKRRKARWIKASTGGGAEAKAGIKRVAHCACGAACRPAAPTRRQRGTA